MSFTLLGECGRFTTVVVGVVKDFENWWQLHKVRVCCGLPIVSLCCNISQQDSHVVRVTVKRVSIHQQSADHRTAGEGTRNASETCDWTQTHTQWGEHHTAVTKTFNVLFVTASYQDRGTLCWAWACCPCFLFGREVMQSCPATSCLY